MMITVLRMGHRQKRDERVSTHCGLVARALGADEIIYSGEEDQKLLDSVRNVAKNWGGPFKVSYSGSWRQVVKSHQKRGFAVVHLTMYGLPIKKVMQKARKRGKVLIIIGAEKVPGEVYRLADLNIAVTNQPHSEIAALAIFLHDYFRGKERKFKNAKVRVIPQEKGKKVID